MQIFGRTSVSEFLGNRIVYRNLLPFDERLPTLDTIRDVIGLRAGQIPRKSEPDYARVIVYLLQQARQLDGPTAKIERFIFVGDTRLNDGTAFSNICQAGGWPGLAFIGSETEDTAAIDIVPIAEDQSLYLSNRWAGLSEFDRYCASQNFPIDENTAIVVDLDKTALGARGRNAHTIDQARVAAVHNTVAALLGDNFDEIAFKIAYDALNKVEYHPFTGDNQDYLAYICLILGSGLYQLEAVSNDVQTGRLTNIKQFMADIDKQAKALPQGLADIHQDIYSRVQKGDPTPFKVFRRNEYFTTIARMGHLDDGVSLKDLLADEIVITQEVRNITLNWQAQGALVFGLSDKPDEASVPTPELAAQGYVPIHQIETHAVGM